MRQDLPGSLCSIVAGMAGLLLALAAFLTPAMPAHADEAAPDPAIHTTLSWALRGGFDANPRDTLDRRGSPLFSTAASLVHERMTDDSAMRLSLVTRSTHYNLAVIDPANAITAIGDFAVALTPALANRVTVTASHSDDDSSRANTLSFHDRIAWHEGPLELFINSEGALSSLNERNILLGSDFLPEDRLYTRTMLTPGLSLGGPGKRIGISLALSHLQDLARTDFIGLNRSQSRVQPFLFFSLAKAGFALDGAVSEAYVNFPYGDFHDIVKPLYSAHAHVPLGPFGLDLTAVRSIEQTTFPIASDTLIALRSAHLSWKPDDLNSVGIGLAQKRETYIEADISTRVSILSVDYARRIAKDTALTLTASGRRTRTTGLRSTKGIAIEAGIERRMNLD